MMDPRSLEAAKRAAETFQNLNNKQTKTFMKWVAIITAIIILMILGG